MVTDDQGRVALRHICASPAKVMNDKYFFRPRRGLSLAWVEPEDVEELLGRIIGCCDKSDPLFYLATQRQVDDWLEDPMSSGQRT